MPWNAVANIKGPQGDEGDPGTTSWDDLEDKPAVVVGSSNGTPAGKTCWTGTLAQYNAIGSKDSNTIYFCV